MSREQDSAPTDSCEEARVIKMVSRSDSSSRAPTGRIRVELFELLRLNKRLR